MADAASIVARVRALGANIELTEAGLHIVNRARLPAKAIEFITTHRKEIADVLRDETDVFEERAAIIEFEGHAPREWAEQFARTLMERKPASVNEVDWTWFLMSCGRIIDEAPRAA